MIRSILAVLIITYCIALSFNAIASENSYSECVRRTKQACAVRAAYGRMSFEYRSELDDAEVVCLQSLNHEQTTRAVKLYDACYDRTIGSSISPSSWQWMLLDECFLALMHSIVKEKSMSMSAVCKMK